jgi:hypothetical protein
VTHWRRSFGNEWNDADDISFAQTTKRLSCRKEFVSIVPFFVFYKATNCMNIHARNVKNVVQVFQPKMVMEDPLFAK